MLTLVGGGLFANPVEQIVAAIAAAHATWSPHSALQWCSRPLSTGAELDGLPVHLMLQDALVAAGVPEALIQLRLL